MNETKIDDEITLFYKKIEEQDPGFKHERQSSENKRVQRGLKEASKSGSGIGKPDHILTHSKYTDCVVVIESKADLNKHISKNMDKEKDFAVDGACYYGEHLAKKFPYVFSIGISGESKDNKRVSTYLQFGNERIHLKQLENSLFPFEKYVEITLEDESIVKEANRRLMHFSKEFHEFIRAKAKIPEDQKPLFVGSILVALKNKSFFKGWMEEREEQLADSVYEAVKKELENGFTKSNKLIQTEKIKTVLDQMAWIKTHPFRDGVLRESITRIYEKAYHLLKLNSRFDILGHFYEEFLSYSAGDGSILGIVLTPFHITEIMCDLAEISFNSVVYDPCVGTGSFLITAMDRMIRQNPSKEENIKSQLVGIESNPKMFALCALNMILRGDGKSNLFINSCFKAETKNIEPTCSISNPPYSQENEPELLFIKHQCEKISVGGLVASIIPMGCMVSGYSNIKEELFKNNSLVAVMTTSPDLFKGAAPNTCITLWKAKIPHNYDNPVWFAKWQNDGFVKTKDSGRVDLNNLWKSKREEFLDTYRNKKTIPGYSCLRKVKFDDILTYEGELSPDWSLATIGGLRQYVMNYLLDTARVRFAINNEINLSININKQSPSFTPESDIGSLFINTKEFLILELFDYERGRCLVRTKDIMDNWKDRTPILSAKKDCNGFLGTHNVDPKFIAPCISIANGGNGGAGLAFYQSIDFDAISTITVLKPKFELGREVGLIIGYLLSQYKQIFSFGMGVSNDRIKSMKIYLPAKMDGSLDIEQMIEVFNKII